MIKLEYNGVNLRQIGREDIEQMRIWRNDPEISRFMLFQDYISPEMQQEWYNTVLERGDLYFIIHWRGCDIGFINLKDINFETKQAEAGIALVSQNTRNSLLPYIATFCLFDFAFETFAFKKIVIHVLDNNTRAVRFNRSLGFLPTDEIKSGVNRKYFINYETYKNKSLKFKRLLELQNNHSRELL